MNNIVTADEAYTAIRAGKTVLCRSIDENSQFENVFEFTTNVFFSPGFEFCIQIEMIELAGISFTKPLTVDEIAPEQDVFVMQPHGTIYQYKYDETISSLVESITCGFAQRDFENAKLQYEAFCKAVGFNPFEANIEIIEQNQKKRSRKQKPSPSDAVTQLDSVNDDVSIDDIIGPVSAQSSTSNDVEKKTSSILVTDDVLINHLLAVSTAEQLDKLEVSFEKHKSKMSDDKVQTYGRILEQKRKELATASEKPTTNFDAVASAAVNHAQKLDAETQQKNTGQDDQSKYEQLLQDLKKRIDESTTVNEVNAVVRYTSSWSDEQRIPLLQYMTKRLEEIKQAKQNEQPSLMVRIQNAPDLAALDALEVDVYSMEPIAQPVMMRHVRTRRLELEQCTLAANDEALP
ncbi:hypothetical protein QSV37_04985 [Acinetobacter sp. VNK23]|uniref:hypothetical protein n=1 Tax=Acinetobacter thutiue TaxID=2998078 RepID=UPI0025783E4A|nr:hypothetical protein [Acinetobacter thutiue]MDM1019666.1 hypothetical protein [Acinetobacter thutiue]